MHLHHRFMESLLPLSGFSGGLAFLFAQGDTIERWGSMGAAVVISCLLAYIITQRDPKAQEKVAELIKTITEQNSRAIEKIQQECAIAMQGMAKDHKELMQTTIKDMINEKVQQRHDLIEHFNHVVDILRGECFEKTRVNSNDKGDGA